LSYNIFSENPYRHNFMKGFTPMCQTGPLLMAAKIYDLSSH
jgi:hypothetical protein